VNPAESETYPVITHHRRIAPGSLVYFIETAPDLNGTWSIPPAGQLEEMGAPTPTGDGVTETGQLRIKPSLDDSPEQRFLRVGVRVP
jgi:hypothetical protein